MKSRLQKAVRIVWMAVYGVVLCCAGLASAATAEPANAAELERLVHYFVYIRSLTPEALQRERAQQELVLAEQKSAVSRLKMALLLSLPGANRRDKTRALELLQASLQAEQPSAAPLRDMAYVVLTLLTEQADATATLASKNRRVPRCEEQLQMERRNVQKLQKQIEELKNLEKTLIERDGTTQKGT